MVITFSKTVVKLLLTGMTSSTEYKKWHFSICDHAGSMHQPWRMLPQPDPGHNNRLLQRRWTVVWWWTRPLRSQRFCLWQNVIARTRRCAPECRGVDHRVLWVSTAIPHCPWIALRWCAWQEYWHSVPYSLMEKDYLSDSVACSVHWVMVVNEVKCYEKNQCL